MSWSFRRHWGSRSEAPTPTYRVSRLTEALAPPLIRLADAFTPSPATRRALVFAEPTSDRPHPLTARQSLTASLTRDPDLAARPDHLMTLVDDILLDLADNGLTVVASGEVE